MIFKYFGDEHPLDLYFAYGIRNSMGIDLGPVTGNLWNTENGPNFRDEINLLKPFFLPFEYFFLPWRLCGRPDV